MWDEPSPSSPSPALLLPAFGSLSKEEVMEHLRALLPSAVDMAALDAPSREEAMEHMYAAVLASASMSGAEPTESRYGRWA